MTVTALRAVSKGQNGVGAFILQCKRIDIHYCDWGGSSKGMKSYIKHALPTFARNNPQIELSISPRPHRHPLLVGHYVNGGTKPICVRNLSMDQIVKKAEILRTANGSKLKRAIHKPVRSFNESVRGIWSPFHTEPHKI